MKPNGQRNRVTLTVVANRPANASVLEISGGPFIAEAGADTDYVCGSCGRITASVPGAIRFASDRGPVVFVCYGCRANNLAP
jgi:hypothetical protein